LQIWLILKKFYSSHRQEREKDRMSVKRRCFLIPLILWMLGEIFVCKANLLWADIYRYVDPSGVTHFTNVPTDGRFTLFLREERGTLSTEDFYRFDHIISRAAEKYDIEFELIKAVIKVESNFDSLAVSKKGARGLMQLMPPTAKELRVLDSFDPIENIDAGTRYLKSLLGRFKDNLRLALAAYNAGNNAVIRNNGQIPPYKETKGYVKKVLRYFKIYLKNPDYMD
jgi:soluble lytic murein transglycosylase